MRNILNELQALQRKYFAAIDEAFQAKDPLGDVYFQKMRDHLFRRYEIEYKQLMESARIPDKNTDFETKLEIYELTPHRRGFLWLKNNLTKKLKIREMTVQTHSEHELLTARIEELEEQFPDKKLKKKLKRRAKKQLKDALRRADDAEPTEVFNGEPTEKNT